MNIDFEILEHLQKNLKKKYIKKLIDFCLAASNFKSIPSHFHTPASQSFPSDLELTAQQAHRLVCSLIKLIGKSQQNNFQNIISVFPQSFNPEVKSILIQILESQNFRLLVNAWSTDTLKQGSSLVDLDWKLDLKMASQKGKTNASHVSVQLKVAKNSRMTTHNIEMNSEQFEAFFKNLQKIKEQLTSLVQAKQKE